MKNFNLEDFDLLVKAIRSSRTLRRKLAQWSFPMFKAIYLPPPEDIAVPVAPFQKELYALAEGKEKLCVIAGFRGCGKTSIISVAFPIWAIISGRAKFSVIASQTLIQSRERLGDIRRIFENNSLLRNDFGAMEVEADQWGVNALNFPRYGARIIAVSTEQSIRGKLYDDRRPDIICLDDIEDSNSTRTQEARNKIYNWFLSEIVPLGNTNGSTRIFVLGNFLHEFSLVGRLSMQIQLKQRDGVAKRYPLLDDMGKCLWPGMFPNEASIEAKRREINDDAIWSREYLLTIISDSDKLVPLSYIHFYDPKDLPSKKDPSYAYTCSAVDLAISQTNEADFTAIVSAQVYRTGEDIKIYILPDPIQKKVNFSEAIESMQQLLEKQGEPKTTKMFIESVSFQDIYYQQMFRDGYHQVESVKPKFDKRTRLALITKFIKDGTIVLPRDKADALIIELIGFGKENHDDLVDSLTMLVSKVLENHSEGHSLRNWFNWVKKNGSMFVDFGNSQPMGSYKPLVPEGRGVQSLVNYRDEVRSRYLDNNDSNKESEKSRIPPPAPRNPKDDAAGAALQDHLRSSTPKQNVRQILEDRSSTPAIYPSIPSRGYSSVGYSGGYSGGGDSSNSERSSRSSGGGSLGSMLGGAARRSLENDN